MIFKQTISERIGQSFWLLLRHFFPIFIPLALFYVGVYMGVSYLSFDLLSWIDKNNLYSVNNYMILLYVGGAILGYLTIQMCFFIGAIKTIWDIIWERKYSLIQNYFYWLKNILSLFKTYYFMFMYVYFLPSIIFIACGIYILYLLETGWIQMPWGFMEQSHLTWGFHWQSLILPLFAFFLFAIIYCVYRSYKTIFSLITAIDLWEYTKENFLFSLRLTKGNWWRIWGNLYLVGLMFWVINIVFSTFFQFYSFSQVFSDESTKDMIMKMISGGMTNFDGPAVMEKIQNYFSSPSYHIQSAIMRVFETFVIAYGYVFTFIFYKRLDAEQNRQEKESSLL